MKLTRCLISADDFTEIAFKVYPVQTITRWHNTTGAARSTVSNWMKQGVYHPTHAAKIKQIATREGNALSDRARRIHDLVRLNLDDL